MPNASRPLADEVKSFAPQRCLQAVGQVSLDFPADMDGFLAKGCIEGQRLLNRYGRGRMAGLDFYQGNQVRRIEWMAEQHTLCRAALWISLIRMLKELVAISVLAGAAASIRAMRSRLISIRSGSFS